MFHRMICKVIDDCSMLCNTICIQKTKGAFWSNELSDLKKKSLDAYKLWIQCNKPRTGGINLERFQTKCDYKKSY